ncbi:MAG: hypothetical protein HY673_25490 [Chloroflexi bacterium]|nr:hypothetical protein [Chloroflexota bacterium]
MVLAAIAAGVASYLRVYLPGSAPGQLPFPHWMGIGGAALAAAVVPAYSILKRRRPRATGVWLKMHVFGNLLAFQLITIHFGYRSSDRSPEVDDTGTGLLLYVVAAGLVSTGIMRRFRIAAGRAAVWNFLHVSLMVSFYLIVIRHVLAALKIL